MKTRLEEGHLLYWCPGCKGPHAVDAKRWNWNGDLEQPTLSPSVRHFVPAGAYGPEATLCHYFLVGGVLQFCSDCPHELAGQNVPLEDWPEDD